MVQYCQAIEQQTIDAYDHAAEAYTMADNAYSEVMNAWDIIWDLDGRVSNLGG